MPQWKASSIRSRPSSFIIATTRLAPSHSAMSLPLSRASATEYGSIPPSDISPDRDGAKSRLNPSTISGEDQGFSFLPRHTDCSATGKDDVVNGLRCETPLKQNGFKALLFGEGACRQRAESRLTGLASLEFDAFERVALHLAAVGLGDVEPGWGTDRRLVEHPWYAARS